MVGAGSFTAARGSIVNMPLRIPNRHTTLRAAEDFMENVSPQQAAQRAAAKKAQSSTRLRQLLNVDKENIDSAVLYFPENLQEMLMGTFLPSSRVEDEMVPGRKHHVMIVCITKVKDLDMEIRRIQQGALAKNGVLWLGFPKKGAMIGGVRSDVNFISLKKWAPHANLKPVSHVQLNSHWSALSFVETHA